jgi:hypothetical protein
VPQAKAKLRRTIVGNLFSFQSFAVAFVAMFSLGSDVHSDEELDFSTTNSSVSGKDDLAPPSLLLHSSLLFPPLHHPILLFFLFLYAKHDAPFSFTCKNPLPFFFLSYLF